MPTFRHCKHLRYINPTTQLCTEKEISFRALDGRYTIMIQGSGIWLSAVGRGTVTIDGASEDGRPNGVMSIDDGPYEPLPVVPSVFPLGTANVKP